MCIKLIPQYFYNRSLPKFGEPEIKNQSLDKMLLRVQQLSSQFKFFKDPVRIMQFAIDPPFFDQLDSAFKYLQDNYSVKGQNITGLGKWFLKLPLDIIYSKLVFFGKMFDCEFESILLTAIIGNVSYLNNLMIDFSVN